jgi:hypothetical protein
VSPRNLFADGDERNRGFAVHRLCGRRIVKSPRDAL